MSQDPQPQAPTAPTLSGPPTAGGCAPVAPPPELADHPRYRVVRLIGAGGMGAVYQAEHKVMERPVALKVVRPDLTGNAAAVERFVREVKAAAKLSHPNIVAAHDAEQSGNVHFLVMEYVEGVDLGRVVAEQGKLPRAAACHYVRQAAFGLQHAFEKGMVHRDIKPANLMLVKAGSDSTADTTVYPFGLVKILDFGLARFASSAGVNTASGVLLGTVDYMAPEQADNARSADIRADIYSLGCTLYYLLAAQVPFPAGTTIQKVMAHVEKAPRPLTDFRDDLPPELLGVIARLMAKRPEGRFQAPADAAKALAPFAGVADGSSFLNQVLPPAPEPPPKPVAVPQLARPTDKGAKQWTSRVRALYGDGAEGAPPEPAAERPPDEPPPKAKGKLGCLVLLVPLLGAGVFTAARLLS